MFLELGEAREAAGVRLKELLFWLLLCAQWKPSEGFEWRKVMIWLVGGEQTTGARVEVGRPVGDHYNSPGKQGRGLDWQTGDGNGEKGWDWGYVLKIKLTGFAVD